MNSKNKYLSDNVFYALIYIVDSRYYDDYYKLHMHGKLYKETFVYRKIVKDKVKYIDLFDDSIYTKTGISSCENVGEVYVRTDVLIPYNALLYSLDIKPKKNTDKKMIKKMKKLIYERRNINSEKNI